MEEAKRENHLNNFKEKKEDIREKIYEFRSSVNVLNDVGLTLRVLYPDFIRIVRQIGEILLWLEVSITQEFSEDEEFLMCLRNERDEIREFYSILYHLAPSLVGEAIA